MVDKKSMLFGAERHVMHVKLVHGNVKLNLLYVAYTLKYIYKDVRIISK